MNEYYDYLKNAPIASFNVHDFEKWTYSDLILFIDNLKSKVINPDKIVMHTFYRRNSNNAVVGIGSVSFYIKE